MVIQGGAAAACRDITTAEWTLKISAFVHLTEWCTWREKNQ